VFSRGVGRLLQQRALHPTAISLKTGVTDLAAYTPPPRVGPAPIELARDTRPRWALKDGRGYGDSRECYQDSDPSILNMTGRIHQIAPNAEWLDDAWPVHPPHDGADSFESRFAEGWTLPPGIVVSEVHGIQPLVIFVRCRNCRGQRATTSPRRSTFERIRSVVRRMNGQASSSHSAFGAI